MHLDDWSFSSILLFRQESSEYKLPFYSLRIYQIYITVANHRKQSLPSLGSSPCWWTLLLSTLHLPAWISQPWILLSGSSWQGCVFLQWYHYKFLEHCFRIATFTVSSFWCYLDNLQGNFLCFWVRVSDFGPEMLRRGCSIFAHWAHSVCLIITFGENLLFLK